MKERREIFCLFICEEAEKFYNNHINMYPDTLPVIIHNHEIGDYAYLPELYVMNEVVSNLSISVLFSWEKKVAFGDLWGRVSIFDTISMKVIKTIEVNGAVSCIDYDNDNESLVIDYIFGMKFESPESLTCYKKANRTYFKLD